MLSTKNSLLVCLGASLPVLVPRFSIWAKMALVGGAWLLAGGFKTLSIVIKTMPRDFSALVKLVRLVFHIKMAERANLSVPRMFENSARRYPENVLFYYKDEEWTFKDIEEYSNRIADFFLRAGYVKGDSVAVFMGNKPQFVGVWLGLAKIGCIPALINSNLRSDPLIHSIKVAKCKAVIFSTELGQAIESIFGVLMNGTSDYFPAYSIGAQEANHPPMHTIPGGVDLEATLHTYSCLPVSAAVSESIGFTDKLMYIYTSGTTGMPKAAVIKHSRYILAAGGLMIMAGVKRTDRVYCPLPLYHSVGGMVSLSGCMNGGISMVMKDKFSASTYWKDCVKYKVTVAQYIGEICRYLLNTPESEFESQHSVRLMFGNGLRPEIWAEFTHRFNIKDITEFYGSTEGNSQILNSDNTVGAVGFVPVLLSTIIPLGLIKVDESGEPIREPDTGLCIRCKAGEQGEFVGIIKQNQPLREFVGYSDKESTSKKVIHNVWSKGDMCFRSGDILVCDEYGYFYFKDRKGDTYRWKGENVSTAEVEGVISRSAGLTDVVVYGVKVPNCEGRVGMAAIVQDLGSGTSVDLPKLAGDLKARLPSYAQPAFIRIVRELDMTGTFKLKKRDLQVEGFDVSQIQDPMFFLQGGQYKPLTKELYNDITEGRVRM